MPFHILKINPKKEFQNLGELLEVAGISQQKGVSGKLLRVPLIVAVVGNSGIPVWDATLFLAEHSLWSHSTQGDTVRTYGECLVVWFDFLARNKINPKAANELLLEHFRNEQIDARPSGEHRSYSTQTIVLRVKTVMRFYSWAERKGVFSSPLGRWLCEGHENTRPISRIGVSTRPRITPFVEARIPRILTKDELKSFFNLAKNPFALQFKWAVVSGLRRFELCELRLSDLGPFQDLSAADNRTAELTIRRKGGRDVTIYAPLQLIEETRWYVFTERTKPLPGFEDHVFISKTGRAVEKSYLSREFRRIADQIGSPATLHHLRHTFAIYTLQILQDRAEKGSPINPLKTLQILMGHALLESTEIYLRALDMQNDAVEEALAYLYGESL